MIAQLNLSENVALLRCIHLPFSDHGHRLVACQGAVCRVEGKEPQTGLGAAFDEAVVLRDQLVQVCDLTQLTRRRELVGGFKSVHSLLFNPINGSVRFRLLGFAPLSSGFCNLKRAGD